MKHGTKQAEGDGLARFLDALEAPVPSPCGGSAAAVTAAMAASLVTMVAEGSRKWTDAAPVAAQGRALRSRLTTLGEADAAAFAHVLDAMRERSGPPEEQGLALAEALFRAAEVPLQIAEAAADVVELAARAAADGALRMRSDAVCAAMLAEAAARASAQLVGINLRAVPGDRSPERAAALDDAAADACARALRART